MNSSGKPPGRSRPTNNQLLYKAHFRWKHYTSPLPPEMELPEGTQACASVTSAFLQVLATMHAVEAARLDRPRNVLRILATNTRRTKVVELSSGTHRVADELRRHSLPDGEGGQYSTNLDRNRYGSDNNYLFTVTRFNLACVGLCPCLVDIEIMDTRNGNEVQLVQAGEGACACDSPERRERADVSTCAESAGGIGGQALGAAPQPPPGSAGATSPGLAGLIPRPPSRELAAPYGSGPAPLQQGGPLGGMRRAPSSGALRRNPSSQRLAEHSRVNSGGSELFDALLAAANDGTGGVGGRAGDGSPEGGPRRAASSGLAPLPGRARMPWNASFNEVDSLQNAIDAFRSEDEVGTGLPRVSSRTGRRMLRRNSVSMIIENPVLAQTGAGDSLLLGPGLGGFPGLQSEADLAVIEGAGGPTRSAIGGGGGANAEGTDEVGGGGVDDEHASFRSGLLRTWNRSASGLNIARAGVTAAAPDPRHAAEVRGLREEVARLEARLEESRARETAAAELAAGLGAELRDTRAAARKAALVMRRLRDRGAVKVAVAAGDAPPEDPTPKAEPKSQPVAQEGGDDSDTPAALDVELASAAAGLLTEEDLASVAGAFLTGEAELEMLRAELAEARTACAKAVAARAEVEERLAVEKAAHATALRATTAVGSPVVARGAHAPSPPLPPGQHLQLPPLNPGSHASAFRPPLASGSGMHKVASMPSLKRGVLSLPEPRGMLALPRRGSDERPKRPRTPIAEGSEDSQPDSKRPTALGDAPSPLGLGASQALEGAGETAPADGRQPASSAAQAPGSRSSSPPPVARGAAAGEPVVEPEAGGEPAPEGGMGGRAATATPAAVTTAVAV